MLLTLWRVDVDDLRREVSPYVPDGVDLVARGRHALLFTAFVRYEPGSVLSYDELLVAAVGRRGPVPVATIPHIWVDSPASEAGGRALWGIPKGLATFEQSWGGEGPGRRRIAATAARDGAVLAAARAREGAPLPGWRRVPMPTAQTLGGRTTFAQVQALARVRLARADWTFPAGSPLAFVGRGRPLFSAVLRDMTIRFGPSVSTAGAASA
jgi:hypothetical protein